ARVGAAESLSDEPRRGLVVAAFTVTAATVRTVGAGAGGGSPPHAAATSRVRTARRRRPRGATVIGGRQEWTGLSCTSRGGAATEPAPPNDRATTGDDRYALTASRRSPSPAASPAPAAPSPRSACTPRGRRARRPCPSRAPRR